MEPIRMDWRSPRSSRPRGLCLVTVLLFALLAFVVLSFALRGCQGGLYPVAPLQGEGWSVGGVRLRESLDQVRSRLGPATRVGWSPGGNAYQFQDGSVIVKLDKGGRVTQVWARAILQGAVTRVKEGASEADVRTALGNTRAIRHYQPQGSGVVASSHRHNGTTFVYQWGGDELTVFAYEGVVQSATAIIGQSGAATGR